MNQTGDIGKKLQGGTMRTTGLDPNQVQLEINPYAEEPRANLYNIVKNIRENKVWMRAFKVIGRLHESPVRCKE
jgi:hypothetical protein